MAGTYFADISKHLRQCRRAPWDEARARIAFIDGLVSAGEEPYEMEYEVHFCAQVNAFLFFGWLAEHGYGLGAEVLMQMAEGLFEHVYLLDRGRRRATLANASKRVLEEYIHLLEFAVSEEQWRKGVNPFDGLRLFFRYLDEIQYPGAHRERRERAIAELQKRIKKKPCLQVKGYELVQ